MLGRSISLRANLLIFESSEMSLFKFRLLIETAGIILLGLRVKYAGCYDSLLNSYYFSIHHHGAWNLTAGYTLLQQGQSTFSADTFYKIKMEVRNTLIRVFIEDQLVVSQTDSKFQAGFVISWMKCSLTG